MRILFKACRIFDMLQPKQTGASPLSPQVAGIYLAWETSFVGLACAREFPIAVV